MVELAARAHANHVAFLARAAEHSGGAVERMNGGVAFACGHPFPFLNALIPAGETMDPEALMEGAARFFAAQERPAWSLFTRATVEDEGLERTAETRGLTIVNPDYPEMVTTEPLDQPRLDPTVELREVADPEEVAAYWRLCGEAYASLGFPSEIFDAFAKGGLLAPPTAGCLAWLDGTPVGGATVIVLEGVGFVGWVAASPAARGRGVGAAVTAWVTNRAFEDGADFASLQASPMGRSVYERLGYRTLFSYRVWRYASDAGQISR
jgi:GNAT superfamily N-acetyltransferase